VSNGNEAPDRPAGNGSTSFLVVADVRVQLHLEAKMER
jgi:hypothetical protein